MVFQLRTEDTRPYQYPNAQDLDFLGYDRPNDRWKVDASGLAYDAGLDVIRTIDLASRSVLWTDDTDFGKGTDDDTEVSGSGEDAVVQLLENADNNDNILYTTAGNYTLSDGATLEVSGGEARLKAINGSETDWTFTTSGNYTFNSVKIEVVSGNAQLKGISNIYAHWHLNESSGSTASDSSGNGRNGTLVNMEDADWVAGKLNNCLSFDGVDEYVNCGQIASFERTDAFSVEFWMKPSGLTNEHIISKMTSQIGWSVHTGNTGVIYVTLLNQSSGLKYARIVTNSAIFSSPYTTWYHIVFVNDGTGDVSGMKIYVDGVLQGVTTVSDTLGTATIINTNDMNISGTQNGSSVFAGDIDEVVIYDDVLTAAEVTTRYNSGTGTEVVGYDQTNPTITNNTGFVFLASLASFTETSTKPTGAAIQYNVSSDNGATWEYWTGSAWAVADGTYTKTSSASDINTNIGTLASSGTFKFKAFLNSTLEIATPLLDVIEVIEPQTYSTTDDLYVDTKAASQISPATILSWLTSTITNTMPASTDIKLLLSTDGRVSWFTYTGGSWQAPASATTRTDATSIIDAQNNFSSLGLGSSTLDVRLFLYTSDNSVRPNCSNINVISYTGFATSGTYTSNSYDSTYNSLDWGSISYNVTIPGTGTLTIKVRTSSDNVVWGSWSNAYTSGEETTESGRYIQWKVDFTDTGETTPKVEDVSLAYVSPITVTVSP